ncbi:MAG: hypothetical protein QGI09_11025 [Dehalococcoidia bacterium]|nr:hypothetical protein [Dehalococcoidia bacterium]|tara:strand:- start:304 stop:528 length:225 start_codon:yes stop_codon:yes gene_type:complete
MPQTWDTRDALATAAVEAILEPKAPQPCINCGEMVQTFADWFSGGCALRTYTGHRLELGAQWKLPFEKEANHGN